MLTDVWRKYIMSPKCIVCALWTRYFQNWSLDIPSQSCSCAVFFMYYVAAPRLPWILESSKASFHLASGWNHLSLSPPLHSCITAHLYHRGSLLHGLLHENLFLGFTLTQQLKQACEMKQNLSLLLSKSSNSVPFQTMEKPLTLQSLTKPDNCPINSHKTHFRILMNLF